MPAPSSKFGLPRISLQYLLILFSIIFLAIFSLLSAIHRMPRARGIQIVSGLIPPHMDEKGRGAEAKAIRDTLTGLYGPEDIVFHVLPFSRHWYAFLSDDRYDAVSAVPNGLTLGGYQSKTYIELQNGVWFRRSIFPKGLAPNYLEALKGRRVVGFAGASGIIPGLSAALPKFYLYFERKDQFSHSLLLQERTVDAVIADRLIFPEYNKRLKETGRLVDEEDFAFFPISCPTKYSVVFRKPTDRDYFDKKLDALRKEGRPLAAGGGRDC